MCLRINGNAGAHGRHISEETALWLLRETFQLVCWFFLAYLCREKQPCPEFQAPSGPLPEPVCMDLAVTAKERKSLDLAREFGDDASEFQPPAGDLLSKSETCDVSEPEFGEPLDPDADLQAMNMRWTLRKELGKKLQNEAREIGEHAAATLHLEE